jgi:predicted nucleic acid-binding protein
MTTAVDSSVILDVLTGTALQESLSALRKASLEGRLIVCESVIAELRPVFQDRSAFEQFMEDWGLEFVPGSRESALLGGEMLKALLERRRERAGRILADFLIGAHARVHADRLLARDRGYLRDYFADLTIWDPTLKGPPPRP